MLYDDLVHSKRKAMLKVSLCYVRYVLGWKLQENFSKERRRLRGPKVSILHIGPFDPGALRENSEAMHHTVQLQNNGTSFFTK